MPTIFRHRVEAGPVVFNVPEEAPPGAQFFGVDVLDGWRSAPDLVATGTDYGLLRDGMEDGEYFPIRSRFLTLGGAVKGINSMYAEELHDVLVRDAFPRNSSLRLVRYESIPKYVTYRRVEGPNTDWTMEDGFRWDATLRCADPFKYSVDKKTASAGTAGFSTTGHDFPVTFPFVYTAIGTFAETTTATIVNDGTAYSGHLVADITGPLQQGGWRLRNDTTDQEIWFDTSLGSGNILSIDFSTQTATLNGFLFSGRRYGQWWKLAPGPNSIRLYADYDENTTVTITAESAWE